MKKNISILIVTILLLSLLPVGSVSASGSTSLSADEKPLLIYIHKDFESQAEDEQPYGFLLTHKSGEEVTPEMISVKKIEKNGNPDNKAMHVAGVTVTNTNPQARARYGLQWAPLQKDFVISFNFLAENFESAKDITMYYNVTRSRSAKYWDDSANYGISNFKLLEITTAGNITFNKNTTIATEIKAGVWHRLDMVIHMDSHKAEISFNGGEAVSASIPSAIENIAELRINTPLVDGSGWYFDDFKFYESSTLIDDETVDAEWEKWATHELYPGEKYELGRVFNYDVFVY